MRGVLYINRLSEYFNYENDIAMFYGRDLKTVGPK